MSCDPIAVAQIRLLLPPLEAIKILWTSDKWLDHHSGGIFTFLVNSILRSIISSLAV